MRKMIPESWKLDEVKLYECYNLLTRETFQAAAWVGETQEWLQIWEDQAG